MNSNFKSARSRFTETPETTRTILKDFFDVSTCSVHFQFKSTITFWTENYGDMSVGTVKKIK